MTAPDQSRPEHPVVAPSEAVLWTRRVAVGSLLALIVLCLAWELWIAPVRPGGSWLALKALPLLLPLPGLLRLRMYTYRWLSLMVWLYAAEAAIRVGSDRGLSVACAAMELLLCLVLFGACAMHVRVRLRAAGKAAIAQDAARRAAEHGYPSDPVPPAGGRS